MNAFQQRYLEIVQASPYIQSVLKPGREVVDLRYYAYNTVIGALQTPAQVLTLNTPRQSILEMQADSDFVAQYLSAAIQDTATGTLFVNRDVTLQIQDLSTGKNFFNIPTVMSLVAGAGGFPYVFPSPRVINPNTQLQITVNNRDTVNAYTNFFLAIHGTRIFYR